MTDSDQKIVDGSDLAAVQALQKRLNTSINQSKRDYATLATLVGIESGTRQTASNQMLASIGQLMLDQAAVAARIKELGSTP